MIKLNRFAGAAAVLVAGLMAASVPMKSAIAENHSWGWQHRDWHGDWNGYHRDRGYGRGGFYFYDNPGYYYVPPPSYYYPPPGPSFGFSVRIH